MINNFLIVLCIVMVAMPVIIRSCRNDDTDASFFKRSGMYLYTDHKTKLQYLGNGSSLTPRLDTDGKQMRSKE